MEMSCVYVTGDPGQRQVVAWTGKASAVRTVAKNADRVQIMLSPFDALQGDITGRKTRGVVSSSIDTMPKSTATVDATVVLSLQAQLDEARTVIGDLLDILRKRMAPHASHGEFIETLYAERARLLAVAHEHEHEHDAHVVH
jgi:hypothetical protein